MEEAIAENNSVCNIDDGGDCTDCNCTEPYDLDFDFEPGISRGQCLKPLGNCPNIEGTKSDAGYCNWDQLNAIQQNALRTMGWTKESWPINRDPYTNYEITQEYADYLQTLGFSLSWIQTFESFESPEPTPQSVPEPTPEPEPDVCASVMGDTNKEVFNMLANTLGQPEEGHCQVNNRCEITGRENPELKENFLYDFCKNLDQAYVEQCQEYHSIDYMCIQECEVNTLPLEAIDPANPNPNKLHMENAGFEFIKNVINPEDPLFQDFLRIFLTIERNPFAKHDSIDISFSEYLYIKYLQKLYQGKKVLKIFKWSIICR